MRDGLPGEIACRDRLAGRAPVGSGQTVPLDLVLALGEEGARQQLAGDRAVGGEQVQRHVAVEGNGEPQRLEPGQILALDQPRPVHHRQARLHRHGELAAVGETDGSGLQLARLLECGITPARRALEGEDAVDLHAGFEDILDGDAPRLACREVRLHRQDHAGAGLERLFVGGQELPGHGDLLHVTLAVGVRCERLLPALRLGVRDASFVDVLAVGDVHQIPAVAELPEGHMGRALLARPVGRDRAELQAVALEAHVALHPGVVERGRVLPARQHVQVLGVVHHVEPLAVLVAQILDVAAGENPSG